MSLKINSKLNSRKTFTKIKISLSVEQLSNILIIVVLWLITLLYIIIKISFERVKGYINVVGKTDAGREFLSLNVIEMNK